MQPSSKSRQRVRKPLPLVLAPVAAVGIGLAALYPMASAQVATSAPANAPTPRYYGVNLPSASFAPKRKPGVHGKDYLYPTKAIAEPFQAMDMNTVRLSILWERLQPEPNRPLDPGEVERLDKSLAQLAGFSTVIVDIHNYGRYFGERLDKPGRSGAMLADLWSKLATHYKNTGDRVRLMNERTVSTRTPGGDQRSIGCRHPPDRARNMVLVPGTRWTGGTAGTRGIEIERRGHERFLRSGRTSSSRSTISRQDHLVRKRLREREGRPPAADESHELASRTARKATLGSSECHDRNLPRRA